MTIFLKIMAKNRPNTGRKPAVQNRFSGGQKTDGISGSRHYLNSVGPFLEPREGAKRMTISRLHFFHLEAVLLTLFSPAVLRSSGCSILAAIFFP